MKGQYFSFDAVIGATIFILTMMALLSYWYGISSSFEQSQDPLAREAFRVSEMMFTPTDTGFTVGWRDSHFNYSKMDDCTSLAGNDPREFFRSSYELTIIFHEVYTEPILEDNVICTWGDPEAYKSSNETYRFRRTYSFLNGDGGTQLGYMDMFFYQ